MAQIRLDKLVAETAGVTRAQARRLIQKGQVQLAGKTICTADTKVDDAERLTISGCALEHKAFVYLMVNKPQGVVSASRDGRDRTVVDLAAASFPRRKLFPAGRLDKDSTGFVLLTDDGAFAHQILAPRRHVEKTYRVVLDTPLTEQMCRGFAQGVTLASGEQMLPAQVKPLSEDALEVQVVLHQGVYHQIKRMFGVYGAGVVQLHRTAIGPVELDRALESGKWRELTGEELAALRLAAQISSF